MTASPSTRSSRRSGGLCRARSHGVAVGARLDRRRRGGRHRRRSEAGLGITRVLSYQAEASLNDGSLRLILEAFEPEAIPVCLVHREDRLPQS